MKFFNLRNIAIGSFMLVALTCNAQQQTSYMQYMYNTLAINPAYAGYNEVPTFNFSGRSQYQGFEGAPRSAMFTMHGRALDKRIGLGASFLTDKIGATSTTGVYGSYAYKLISRNRNSYTNWEFIPHVLSLGIQAGFTYYNEDLASLDATNDPNFDENISSIVPNFGFGVYYSKNTFFFSLSAPQLIGGKVGSGSNNTNVKRHVYLSAGNKFEISPMTSMDLTTLVKYVQGSPIQADLNGIFTLHQKFMVGAGYSSFSTVNFTVGMNINSTFRFGYFYGLPVQDNLSNMGGVHEVMLTYKVKRRKPMK